MARFGESTREYRTIQRHYSCLVDNLGQTVNPAHFARKLRDKSLISEDIVEAASVVGILTGPERIAPVISAVRAQIKLRADIFHAFMNVLKAENSCLADTVNEYYTSSLELHALGVLESVSDWQELGQHLNINPEKLLHLLQCGRDHEYCREQVVSEWLEEDKEASWKTLCSALERMGCEAEVLKIREQYISSDVPAENSEGADTYLHCTESIVAKEVEEFENRFSNLILHLQTEMEEKRTPVKEFRQSITRLPLTIRKDHSQYIKDSLNDIAKAESIEMLFLYLNLYWTFFDCNLLQHFVKKHGSKELQEEMEKYANDLKVFRKKTTVEHLLKTYPDGFQREEPPPNFSQIILKLERKASDCTLEELELFRCRFCSEISLPTFAVMLASFKKGSITIIWHVPSSEVHCFHNATIRWNLISSELLQFQTDELLLEFATKLDAKVLRESIALTHLYLSNQKINADKVASLSSSLKNKSYLQYLDLSRNTFGSKGAEYLAQALTKNTALNHLELQGCDIDVDGIALLSPSLINKLDLQYVDLSWNMFGSKGAEYLAQALTENTVLTHLKLWWCDIDVDGIALLSPLLKNKLDLQYLDLGGNRFGSKGAEYLAQALKENTALTRLKLQGCDIDVDGIALLSPSLKNKLDLQYLYLGGNRFGSKGAEYLAQALTENTALTHLKLQWCNIGVDGIALLSPSLKNKLDLQYLDLTWNMFGSMGAEHLAQALTENTALTHLKLQGCDIDADGIALLSPSLENKLDLQYLDLTWNMFGSKGAEYLAQALTENTALTHLELRWCDINVDGIALLSPSLKNKLNLRYLDLGGNKFGSKGAEYLAQALTENTALTHLYLDNYGIRRKHKSQVPAQLSEHSFSSIGPSGYSSTHSSDYSSSSFASSSGYASSYASSGYSSGYASSYASSGYSSSSSTFLPPSSTLTPPSSTPHSIPDIAEENKDAIEHDK